MELIEKYVDHSWLLIIVIIIALPIIWQFWKLFFGNLREFISDVTIGGLPDLFAFLTGRFWESEWAKFKIIFFILLSVGTMAALYKLGSTIFY